jgi:hypothetical protein
VTAAAPNNTIVSALPSNQESTMAAFATQPSYPLPPGARAIMQARNALQGSGGQPIYNDPSQLDPSRYAPILGRLRGFGGSGAGGGGMASMGTSFGAPAPNGSPQTMPNDAYSGNDAGNEAMANLQTQAGASDIGTFGQAEQDYGPTTQTAPGGVMDQVDLTSPSGWQNFFSMRNMGSGRPARAPRIMQGSRAANGYGQR